MTLLFADGFDGYTAGGDRTVLDPVYDFNGVIGTSRAGVSASGRVTGKCGYTDVGYIQLATMFGFELDATLLTADSTIIIGFAVKVDENDFHAGSSSRLPLLHLLDSNGDGQTAIYISGSGNIKAVSGDVSSTDGIAFGTARMFSKVWHYVEMKVTLDIVSGAVEVRVDGETVISGSGQTSPGVAAEAFATTLIFGGSNDSARVMVDDLYICDSQGSVNNDFLGEIGIRRLSPDADGATNDFTPLGGGDNYVEVDEDDPDGDTSYVESSTVGHQDLYGVDDLSSTPASIASLQVVATSKSDDGGAKSGKNYLSSSAVEGAGSAYALTSGYVPQQSIHELDPNTSAAWAEAGVNAVQVGMEVTA